MLRFGSPEEFGYEEAYPISCIYAKPIQLKFAEALSHRDFLGALMNLGIERSCIGDIRAGEEGGYFYCQSSMTSYICENLTQVKHTHVKCEVVERVERTEADEPEATEVLVRSLRIVKALQAFEDGEPFPVSGCKGVCGRQAGRKQQPSVKARGGGECKRVRQVYFYRGKIRDEKG